MIFLFSYYPRAQHQKLREIHVQCYQSAHQFAQSVAVFGFTFLCVQFYVFGYFTWYNEAGWDIMEPITWFTGVVEMVIGGFFYYLYRGSEYRYDFIHSLFAKSSFFCSISYSF